MPLRRPQAPAIDEIEQHFIEAINRLRESAPTHKILKKLNDEGRLKITISNVALEAGHSRTLIGMDKCKYPRVREMIKLGKNPSLGTPTTLTGLVKRLRADIAELRLDVQMYQDTSAKFFLELSKAKKIIAEKDGLISRLTKSLKESKNVVHLVNDPHSGKSSR